LVVACRIDDEVPVEGLIVLEADGLVLLLAVLVEDLLTLFLALALVLFGAVPLFL
jgi:hypothetical protein